MMMMMMKKKRTPPLVMMMIITRRRRREKAKCGRSIDGVDERKSVGFGRFSEKYHRQADAADVFAHRVRGSGSDCSRF